MPRKLLNEDSILYFQPAFAHLPLHHCQADTTKGVSLTAMSEFTHRQGYSASLNDLSKEHAIHAYSRTKITLPMGETISTSQQTLRVQFLAFLQPRTLSPDRLLSHIFCLERTLFAVETRDLEVSILFDQWGPFVLRFSAHWSPKLTLPEKSPSLQRRYAEALKSDRGIRMFSLPASEHRAQA